ncbi:uncharacterized protein LOC18421614 isoform X1 [Amborella trichopoda]|uniref:START domain-containing protein n=2 Tax=Amborella trichopoda TaxID=13333 RepID=W1NE65_AMBTC|nr:uncharacterized protein LOC18421614 isoform X1 [Amborella trichopoda]ERM93663.1 hypothetical protein AMTR_s00004p00162830 [Amborella trichopoda]|eukprot:XP_006826426.1 uncharacterized protein LOC18421614 isoform X1 [Amborella trichopoda]
MEKKKNFIESGNVMEKKKKRISENREKLDRTLFSPDLTDKEVVKSIVENQLSKSLPDQKEGDFNRIVQKHTSNVWNLLEMLRSASEVETCQSPTVPHNNWKMKEDGDQIRIMYREGPEGSPYHTLLCEGYIDGAIDNCLCVSWESDLYPKWWPQPSFPTFKVMLSKSLKKLRIGEEISLIRLKVPWPLSTREVILHYCEIEYFEQDLIIVLLNSVSETESPDSICPGLTFDRAPEDVVRVDVVGGFALQKVSSKQSYFRTIANMDIKMEFIPPSLINFISRQLIGDGFRLYQKSVASAAAGDEDFRKVLEEGPMYKHIREALSHSQDAKNNTRNSTIDEVNLQCKENLTKIEGNNLTHMNSTFVAKLEVDDSDQNVSSKMEPTNLVGLNQMRGTEIEEEHENGSNVPFKVESLDLAQINKPCTTEIEEDENELYVSSEYNRQRNDTMISPKAQQHTKWEEHFISPEVKRALEVLERAIGLVHRDAFRDPCDAGANRNHSEIIPTNLDSLDLEKASKIIEGSNHGKVRINSMDATGSENQGETHEFHVNTACRDFRSSPHSDEENLREEPNLEAIPEASLHSFIAHGVTTSRKVVPDSDNMATISRKEAPDMDKQGKASSMEVSIGTNGLYEGDCKYSKQKPMEKKRHRVCCFHFS